MGFKCPQCSTEIPNVLTQEQHVERINAKSAENTALKEQLTAAQQQAQGYGEIKAERDRLLAEVSKRDKAAERALAFDKLGIPNTPAIRKGFELVYDSEQTGAEQPAAFEDWLGNENTKGHPLLSAHYVKPAAQQQGAQQGAEGQGTAGAQQGQRAGQQGGTGQQAAGQQQAGTLGTTRPQGGLTNVDRGAAPPSAETGPRTASELQEYFRSDAYRALPLDKQKEEKARLRGQLQSTQRSG